MDTSISRRDARIILIIGIVFAIAALVGWLVVAPAVATWPFYLTVGASVFAVLALVVGTVTLVRKR